MNENTKNETTELKKTEQMSVIQEKIQLQSLYDASRGGFKKMP